MNTTSQKRLIVAGVLVAVLGAATFANFAFKLNVGERLSRATVVREAKASGPAPVATTVRADGRVASYPNASVTIGTEKGGALVTFTVSEKQALKKGEVVAEIDSSETRAAMGEAYAGVQQANVSIGFLKSQIAKSKKLEAAGAISRDEVDRLQHQLDQALAQRNAAAATAHRLATSDAKSKVKAPFDGVVLERFAEQGEVLPPGARLLTIADLSRVRIEAEVDEFDAARVVVGAPVTITAEGHQGSWKGKVEEVPDAITPRRIRPDDPTRATDTRVLLVKIAFIEPTPLRLGQRVEVSIGR